jgi:hypothetical protein
VAEAAAGTPSAAAPTGALVDLPRGADVTPVDAAASGAETYTADGGTPGGDAGAPDPPTEAARHAEDHAVLAAIVDDVRAHVGGPATQNPIAGTDDRFRAQLIAAVGRIFDAVGAVVLDPVAGSPSSPALTARRALGLGPKDAIPPDAATQLLSRTMRTSDPYVVDSVLDRFISLSDDVRTSLYASDPDASDAIVRATLADLEQGDFPKPALREEASGQVKVVFGERYREALRATRKRFRKALGRTAEPDPQKRAQDGQLAHQIIMAEYWEAHQGHDIIFDTHIWDAGTESLQYLSDVAAGNARIAAVRDALVSTVTNAVGQPDILDLSDSTVYEIKPITQIYEGAAQLGGRYLYFLNAVVFGSTKLSEQLIAALLPGGGSSWPPPTKFQPYMPGMWRPLPITPLPDGRLMATALAAPGVIVYQIFGERKKGENSPSEAELKLIETFALAALAAIAAGNLAIAPDADVLDGEHVIQSPVTRAPVYLDELRQLIGLTLDVAAGASVAVLLAQLVTTIELGELFAGTAATLEALLGLLLLA